MWDARQQKGLKLRERVATLVLIDTRASSGNETFGFIFDPACVRLIGTTVEALR